MEVGLNIGAQNGIQRQLKARGPVWGPTGPSLCSQHSKLKITDIGQPFVACPALRAPIQESHDHLMAPKCHLTLTQGLRKTCHRNQTRDFGARHTVEYDSVLRQQSISGEIVSLMLYVWKPGFFKSARYIVLSSFVSCVSSHACKL